jgi:hypothetical protein
MKSKYKSLADLMQQDEILLKDIIEVLKNVVKTQAKLVFFILLFFISLSLIDYSLSNVEYESKASVLIEAKDSQLGANISLLSGLLGGTNKNNGSSQGLVSPDMYSAIISSQAFLNTLVSVKIPSSPTGKDSITLEQYFSNGAPQSVSQKIKGLPASIINIFSSSKPTLTISSNKSSLITYDTSSVVKNYISPEMLFSSKIPPIVQLESSRAEVVNIIRQRIKLEINGNSAILSVKMPSSFIAAATNKLLLEQLFEYVTQYNTLKQRSSLEFLENRYEEAKQKYLSLQQKLAGVNDNSVGLIFQSAQTRQQFLANEVSLSFNVYNQFASQVETAKIELKKETPLFSILEPIAYPSPQIEPYLSKKIVKYLSLSLIIIFLLIIYKIIYPKKN